MPNLKKNVGNRFRVIREKHGYTREALAEALQTTATSIYRIERGEQWISPGLLEKAVKLFQVDAGLIFTDSPSSLKPSAADALAVLAEAHGYPLASSKKGKASAKNSGRSHAKAHASLVVSEAYTSTSANKHKVPLMLSQVRAGSPTFSDDDVDKFIEVDEKLLKHPSKSFVVKVAGESMQDAGIRSGDFLIVDRSLEPRNNNIVIAVVDGKLTVKRLRKVKRKIMLMPENADFQPIVIDKSNELTIWGVVTSVMRNLD